MAGSKKSTKKGAVTLSFAYDTKHCIRFNEDGPEDAQVLRNLYVRKDYFGEGTVPKKIRVTLEAA